MFTAITRANLRRALSVATLFAFVFTSLVSLALPAHAVETTTVHVELKKPNGAGGAEAAVGESVTACYTVYAPNYQNVCSATVTSDSDGKASVQLAKPDSSVSGADLFVGSSTSEFLYESTWIQLSSGSLIGQGSSAESPISIELEPRYVLTGTVAFGGQPVSGFSMHYTYTDAGTYKCVSVAPTDQSGNYAINKVLTRNFYLSEGACSDQYSGQRSYDSFQISPHQRGIATETRNIELTKTGVEVTVLEGSNPVSDVPLSLVSDAYSFTATSGSDGKAIFVGVQPGVYKVAYVGSPSQSGLQKFETKTNTGTVTVTTGSLSTDTIVLIRSAGYPATPVTVSGKVVTGAAETPVANATVSYYFNNQVSNGIQISQQTRTDASGNYTLSELPYGMGFLSVNVSGYRSASLSLTASEVAGLAYTRNFNLRADAKGGLSYSGTLKEQDGDPIPNKTIYLNSMMSSTPKTAVTDGSGNFAFSQLTEGIYYLNVDYWQAQKYEPLSWNQSYVTLTQSESNVALTLKERAIGTASVSGFAGTYLDDEGESNAAPLAGLDIYLFPQSGGQGIQVTTDSNGEWNATGLIDGEKYWVSAMTFGMNMAKYEYPNSQPAVAKASGAEQHRLLFKEVSPGTGSLTGRVKDSETYVNLAGVSVSLHRSMAGFESQTVQTSSKGEYSFSNLPAGEYYLSIEDLSGDYKSAFMFAEIGTTANRINALLTSRGTHQGAISGVIKDERGMLMPNAYVQVWDPENSEIGGYAQTDENGAYAISGVPTGKTLNFKVEPSWDLRFEVTSFSDSIRLSSNSPQQTIDVSLKAAALVTGRVSGIPASGNVPMVFAQLVRASSGVVAATTTVDPETGRYTITSVDAGSYFLRFTQNASLEGYSGGGGSGSTGGGEGEPISLKPTYWDGTADGTTSEADAQTFVVNTGSRITNKSVTMSSGSSIRGSVTVETPSGVSKLTGTRVVLVTVYKKDASGNFRVLGFPTSVSGYSNSELRVVGLDSGSYKLKYEDMRTGSNSLETVYNGGAATLGAAPEIIVRDQTTAIDNQTMKVAPPQKSAEAFDLDDLGAERLAELENQISVDGSLRPGEEASIYVGIEFAGQHVSVVANSTPQAIDGWQQVDADGYVTVRVPESLSGSHRIAVQDSEEAVIGWSRVEITEPSSAASGTTAETRRGTSAGTASTAVTESGKSIIPKLKSPNPEKESQPTAQNSSSHQSPTDFGPAILGAWLLIGGVVVALGFVAFFVRRRVRG